MLDVSTFLSSVLPSTILNTQVQPPVACTLLSDAIRDEIRSEFSNYPDQAKQLLTDLTVDKIFLPRFERAVQEALGAFDLCMSLRMISATERGVDDAAISDMEQTATKVLSTLRTRYKNGGGSKADWEMMKVRE